MSFGTAPSPCPPSAHETAMVATQLNERLTSNELQKNGIIQVNQCVTNQVQGRK